MIEQRQDDDAETDEEVYRNAIRQVFHDVEVAENETHSENQFAEVISNCSIKARVANPERYDRDGKLRRRYQQRRPHSDYEAHRDRASSL